MKKSLIALAALGAFAGAASAQSSVTLFGVVDLSLLSTSNGGGSLKSMASNSYNSNRLGFRGVEDLGGGLKGAFWLEAGMSNDTGSVGSQLGPSTAGTAGSVPKFFNRRSTLSLMGNFGEIRLGRDYTPQFWNTTVYDAFGTNGPGNSLNVSAAGAAGALGSNAGTFVRADNSLAYFLPGTLGGLTGQVQVSASEGNITNNGNNKHVSFRIGYAAGPLSVHVASGKTETGANDFKMNNIGASFKVGTATLMGYINKAKFGAVDEKLTHLGAWVPFGATTLRLGATRSDGVGTKDATQVAAGVVYDLSKRTAVYADVSRISNKATANYNNGGTANTNGHSARAIDLGVRHSF